MRLCRCRRVVRTHLLFLFLFSCFLFLPALSLLLLLSPCPYKRLLPMMLTLTLQAMLIMTSILRVGQSKFVTVQIDEDASERIMNCLQTLAIVGSSPQGLESIIGESGAAAQKEVQVVNEIFLQDTKRAFSRMLGAQEVNSPLVPVWLSLLMMLLL